MNDYPKPTPTMEMIAVLAGVSRASVSYFYWGKSRNLSLATQARIKLAAERLNYVPYNNDEWFESKGQHILRAGGYDPYAVRDALRGVGDSGTGDC